MYYVSHNVAQPMSGITMPANAVVRARIDAQIKEEATTVLAAMGLTVSDAFCIMLTRVAQEKVLPLPMLMTGLCLMAAMTLFGWHGTRGHLGLHHRHHRRHKQPRTLRGHPRNSNEVRPDSGLFRGRSVPHSDHVPCRHRQMQWL